MALGHSHDHRLQPRAPASMWPFVSNMCYRYQSDTGYGRTTNTDLVLGSSSRSPWSLVAMQSFRINMTPTAMWPSHTNMTPGVILDPLRNDAVFDGLRSLRP